MSDLQPNPGSCVNHPGSPASAVCQSCGLSICAGCVSAAFTDKLLCLDCATHESAVASVRPPEAVVVEPAVPEMAAALQEPPRLRLAKPVVPAAPPPVFNPARTPGLVKRSCTQHAEVEARFVCIICSQPMCSLCTFALPAGQRVCPRCVLAPKLKMSTGRKATVISAYVLAAWCTFGMVLLFGGAEHLFTFNTAKERLAFYSGLGILIFVPSMIGTALGLSAYDKHLPNPGSVKGAAIWNGLLMIIVVILDIIGLSK